MDGGRYGKTTVGVLTVIQEEFDAAKAALNARRQRRRTPYWHGEAGHGRFVLAKMADRTNVVAGEATRDLVEHWRPDVVILMGIAGGLASSDVGLGDVVVPDFLHYWEFRKLTGKGDDRRFAAYDHPSVTLRTDIVEGVRERGAWASRVAVERPEHRDGERQGSDPDALKVEFGGLVAGEKIMGDPDHPEQQRMFVSFEHAIAVDMESWGVGRAVHHQRREPNYNPRLIVVRGISDMVERCSAVDVDPREDAAPADEGGVGDDGAARLGSGVTTIDVNNDQRGRWKHYAAATAAAFTAAVVEDLCDDD